MTPTQAPPWEDGPTIEIGAPYGSGAFRRLQFLDYEEFTEAIAAVDTLKLLCRASIEMVKASYVRRELPYAWLDKSLDDDALVRLHSIVVWVDRQ